MQQERHQIQLQRYKRLYADVGHIAETEQVIEVDFREGNAQPNEENLGFIRKCEAALPAGVSVRRLRADAALTRPE